MQARAQRPPHRKSRLGCRVCKSRKIKCDEMRPVCGNCYKRFPNAEEQCKFGDALQTDEIAVEGDMTASKADSPATGYTFSTTRSMELRLFHHFSTVTCYTMPTCEEPAGLKMWKDVIPSLAFECTYIYSAILGIAALHLLAQMPSDIALKAAAYQYMNETVSAHREEMGSIDSSNALNRFAASVLLTMHAKLRTRCEANTGVAYTLPTNYFMLQIGATGLWHRDLDLGEEVKNYIACYSHLAPRQQPWKPYESHHHRQMGQYFPYDPLPSFVETDGSVTPQQKSTCTRALDYISLIQQCILKGERTSWIQHRIAIAPSVLKMDFYILMQEGNILSLAILARVFALLKFVDDSWWLQGTAEYEVEGLETLAPHEWKWAFEWPLRILETAKPLRSEGGESVCS
ncbi:hypothetical protein PVAG01_07080 [Phlyctema vagabunda]|uniref:Zn(2)-C6 fungal-type domain-containing protein n=1 Tax=Phlyctema vagabunda TaxID=108571 RepID=A0ABR4PBH0_9HELO